MINGTNTKTIDTKRQNILTNCVKLYVIKLEEQLLYINTKCLMSM